MGKDVVVELKNDLSICGTLHSVDQFLNIKLTDISVTDTDKYPHMLSVKNCFIRGSVVRYVQLPGDECDTQLLQDAARKEAAQSKQRWNKIENHLEFFLWKMLKNTFHNFSVIYDIASMLIHHTDYVFEQENISILFLKVLNGIR